MKKDYIILLISKAITRCIIILLCIISNKRLSAQSHKFEWVKQTGSAYTNFRAMVCDQDGYAYGLTEDTDSLCYCVVKVDFAGNLIWVKYLYSYISTESIAIDSNSNIYIAGKFSGTGDFDPGPGVAMLTASGTECLFILKLDRDGIFQFAKKFNGEASKHARSICTDANNNILITGYFFETVDFDPGPGSYNLSSPGNGNVFIVKLDATGNFLWARSFGGAKLDEGRDITTDQTGNVYITGLYRDTLDISANMPPLISNGGTEYFVIKMDSAGNYIWSRSAGGTSNEAGYGIAVDNEGNVYTTGIFSGSADFDPGIGTHYLIANGSWTDIFIHKLDSIGNFVWAKSIGGPAASDVPNGIVIDRKGHIYTVGYFKGTVDFDPGTGVFNLTSNNFGDMYISKLNKNGEFVGAENIQGLNANDYASGTGIALGISNSLYVIGTFSGTVDFNTSSDTFYLTAVAIPYTVDNFILKFYCADTNSYYQEIEECADTLNIHGYTFDSSGVYTWILPNEVGCDSTITFNLTLFHIDKPVINVNNFTLGVTGSYTTYQWTKNGIPIAGETDSTLTVNENADYQVVVTNEHGCTDTSEIYPVNNVKIKDDVGISTYISIYPNPVQDVIYINSPARVNVKLYSLEGRNVLYKGHVNTLNVSHLAGGVYLLHIIDKEGRLIKVEKVVIDNYLR